VGPVSAGRPAVHLHIDLADVHIGRDFTVVLPPEAEQDVPQVRIGLSGLLQRVRQVWIDQVLDELVPDGVLLDFQALREGTIPSAPSLLSVSPEADSGASLNTLFEESGRALLILGEPGSGKTVSLLELARKLVERAERDPAQPVPAVFKLASWSHGLAFGEWLTLQLSEFYKVPRRQARRWIEERRILPLLDGLDEVDPSSQNACVKAINTFIATGTPGIALTCRMQAYGALATPLDVNAAYRLGSLAPGQVLDYVERSGPELEVLSRAIREDNVLLDMARTPLMLRLIADAYRGLTDADVIRDDLETVAARREHVLDAYTQSAFIRADERFGAKVPFDEDDVMAGLAFVARGLHRHSESILLVERLQPSWLIGRQCKLIYLATTRVTGGVMIGLVFGVLLEIMLTFVGGGITPYLAEALNRIGFGVLVGVGGGVLVAAIDLVRFRRGGGDLRSSKPGLLALVYFSLFTLFGLVLMSVVGGTDWLYGIAAGVAWGMVFWLYFGLPSHHRRLRSDIQMPEALRFSRASARRNAWRGALAGGTAGAVLEATLGLSEAMDLTTRVVSIALAGVALAMPAAVIGGVAGGLQRSFVTARSCPNEGFKLALRNMALAGGTIAIASTLISIPLLWLAIGGIRGAALGLVAGPFVGALAALWVGGMDVLRHMVARLLLARSLPAARSLVPFLNYASELGFLQRAGGGYLFVHNIFLDHFASIRQRSNDEAVLEHAIPPYPPRRDMNAQQP
jgi:eukaryotic-like serine/threonine-protein kinase